HSRRWSGCSQSRCNTDAKVFGNVSEPPMINIDTERVGHWVKQGAKMSATVQKLVRQQSAASV
ncbi:MAG: hypothetical protein V3S30_04685, partial [Thermoanaerobaculia bacterium]